MPSGDHSKAACFHCGLDADPAFSAVINDEEKPFCCIGCQAVASAIAEGGLSDFYRFRDVESTKPNAEAERFDAYDLEAVQSAFVHAAAAPERTPESRNDTRKSVRLLIGGISCAACAWLIEHFLESLDGVEQVRVNVASHRCQFIWHTDRIKLSEVFAALHRIGYRPQPGTEAESQRLRLKEKREALLRIGVAGLGMMQVGMVAVALHAGAIQGIDASWQHFLRWVSLVFAVPVMVYSAKPFFVSAYRTLKMRHLNMDVPVSLALILAFVASIFGTYTNTGEVYFDSVSMFTFFLLVGRYLEMQARHTSVHETERLAQLLPVSIERFEKHSTSSVELVPLSYVKQRDCIRVNAGDVVPCDGELISDLAMADESLLTGESNLIKKSKGDVLYAGSILAEPTAKMRVTATGEDTKLASVQALLDEAIQNKPQQQKMADRVASYFVAAVLICFVAVFSAWYVIDSSKAFWVALSVLVVTCPCALSLATPAALAAGLNKLRKQGLLIVSPNALETLPHIDHVALDKTGTLTYGSLRLKKVMLIPETENQTATDQEPLIKSHLIDCVAALEHHSRHPIAHAFKDIKTELVATHITAVPGRGIQGDINGALFKFGHADFAVDGFNGDYPETGSWQLLSQNGQALAWFEFGDEARPDLANTLRSLRSHIVSLSLLSGDRQTNVDQFVQENQLQPLFTHVHGNTLPKDKLKHVMKLQARGEKVLMVGDGINDVPVLAGADLSIAMGSASQLAKVNADAVLLNQNLAHIGAAIQIAKRVTSVIRQNFSWALGYNLLALPAAAMGFIPPYLAALGMSLSSLIVVLNSLRVSR